jgi:hypothetical protein
MRWLQRSSPEEAASVVSQHPPVTWTPPVETTGLAMEPCGLVHRHFSVKSWTVSGESVFSTPLKLVRPGSAPGIGQHAANTTGPMAAQSARSNARLMTAPPGRRAEPPARDP